MNKIKQGFYQWLAWKLPNKLVYFALIRAWTNATTDENSKKEATSLTANEVIKLWELKT